MKLRRVDGRSQLPFGSVDAGSIMIPQARGSESRDVAAVAFSRDSELLAVSSGDPALVSIWDVRSHLQIARFQHSNHAQGVAFSPDGQTIAAANWRGRVYLWDLSTKKETQWQAHTMSVTDVAFSPDGKTLATSSEDATVKLWNVATQREMVTLRDHKGKVRHVAFSPDGNTLASSDDKTILLYRASSLAEADRQASP